jgi:hypothetical protein
MMRAEDYHVERRELGGLEVNVTSYKIAGWYHCHVANVDPGATIVRTDGETREEAEKLALARALERLSNTVRR